MKIKELRLAKKKIQKEVADAIGCSAITYSRYESGKREPDVATICNMAHYFGKSTDEVIGYSSKFDTQ